MDGETRGVGEQLFERHRRFPCERVRGNLPALEELVDVAVERELALLDEGERSHRRDRLADRSRLEECRRRHRLLRLGVGEPVALRPLELPIPDHRDRDALDAVVSHPVRERPGLVALDQHRRPKTALDLRDAGIRRRRREQRGAHARRVQRGAHAHREKRTGGEHSGQEPEKAAFAHGDLPHFVSAKYRRGYYRNPAAPVLGTAQPVGVGPGEPKVTTTGAWSLVPTSARTTDCVAVPASASLASR